MVTYKATDIKWGKVFKRKQLSQDGSTGLQFNIPTLSTAVWEFNFKK